MIHRRKALALAVTFVLLSACSDNARQNQYPTFSDYSGRTPAAPVAVPTLVADGDYTVIDGGANVPAQAEVENQIDSQQAEPGAAQWEPIASMPEAIPVDEGDRQFELAMSLPSPTDRALGLDRAAQSGSGKAHYELAKIYTDGKVRPRNLALAQQHLQAAASLDDPEATRVLGWQMIKGDANTPQNINGGVAIMEIGVSKSVRAQRELGMLYANLYDDYKLDNVERGESYLLSAYRSGDVPAATALGKLYVRDGRQLEAVEPLSYASANGDSAAKKMLARLDGEEQLAERSTVDSNPSENADGEKFYTRASAIMLRSHSAAEEAKAYALFSIASDRGYNLAKAELAAISGVNVQMTKSHGGGWLNESKQAILAGQD